MNADVENTKAYYQSLGESALCNCAYCRSYRRQVKAAFPEAAEYLAAMGIDMEKPFETSPLEPDAKGMLEYCGCQYIVFGNCEPDFHHSIGNVEFRRATSYPGTGIVQEHFVLECYPIKLHFDGGIKRETDIKKVDLGYCSISGTDCNKASNG